MESMPVLGREREEALSETVIPRQRIASGLRGERPL